ncbi:vitamin K epoxide reductase family protein [Gordonia jinhuaensis]|uniref:Membrane protein n=1 Tax=Gordonia jinhuaensis TaxID=1517702 RepID=A0A916T7X9_9ACTN|nr:vitamin K epoxide reductase family protein [Gordonia jinhuaensis]GGB35079.1 membrane protein [Gordonia jinhuaensis]
MKSHEAVEAESTVGADTATTSDAVASARGDQGAPPADDRSTGYRPGIVTSAFILVMGVIGLACAWIITVEKIDLLEDPSYKPSCSINPIISCGSVMQSWQAEVFGFPNPLLGLIGFTVVIVTGVLALSRVDLPLWYWIGLFVGLLAGMAFVFFLIYSALYRINALCPYCIVVWIMTAALLVTVLNVIAKKVDSPRLRTFASWMWTVLALFYVAVFLMIMEHFWYYWKTLI